MKHNDPNPDTVQQVIYPNMATSIAAPFICPSSSWNETQQSSNDTWQVCANEHVKPWSQLTQPHNPSAALGKNQSYKNPFLVWNIHIRQDLIYIHMGHAL